MGQEVIVENIQPLWFLNELGKLHIITLKNYISEVSGRIHVWFLGRHGEENAFCEQFHNYFWSDYTQKYNAKDTL